RLISTFCFNSSLVLPAPFIALLTFFLYLILRPSKSPLFPYTTLFRSCAWCRARWTCLPWIRPAIAAATSCSRDTCPRWTAWGRRSEEHTSELQSRENLVCRLLLEKKKNIIK